jgi:archaellum biogenesis ATPase FlaH
MMTAAQKATLISEYINQANELMSKARELVDAKVARYVVRTAHETDFADAVAGTCLGFADELNDLSKSFQYAFEESE